MQEESAETGELMLIDEFIPNYNVSARYQTNVRSSVERAYAEARNLDMRDSRIIRFLYQLRGLPANGLTLDGMLDWGFVMLADEPSKEIVFGLAGRFWTHKPQIRHLDAEDFAAFEQPGFAKAVGNISFREEGGGTLVATETRVHCPDVSSRRRFRMYWTIISPFSGLIRREWLRLIKQNAEAENSF